MWNFLNSNIDSITKIPWIGEYIFSALVTIVIILLLNQTIKTNFEVNPLKNLLSIFTQNKKYEKERKNFYKVSTTKEFVQWQNEILKKVYSDYKLLSLFDKEYPILINEAKDNFLYPFNKSMSTFSNLTNKTVPVFEIDNAQKRYYKMMGPTIKRPNLIGFEIDQFHLDDNGKIEGFSARVCQYKHNVVTSHILDYEMYQFFKKIKEAIGRKSGEEILTCLPFRKRIHKEKSQAEIITTGCNRHSLLSVQMMVVYYNGDTEDYHTLIIQRSEDVAIKPNYWQLIPAGGFEIFEKEETTNPHIIEENFNIELALFRELIEEAFDGQDFQHNHSGEVNDIINKHKDVIQIKEWLKNGKATLEFLGNVIDLVSLRSELSFLLVIDDAEFGKNRFKINHEGKDYQTPKVNKLPHLLEEDLFYPSSAGLLKLAMQSKLFKERELLQDEKEMIAL